LSKNNKESPAPISTTLNNIVKKLEEIETRLNELDEKVTVFQRGRSCSKGAPSSQVRILKYMEDSPRGSTMKEIQDETHLAKATVSTGLKNLTEIGSVQKVPSLEKDARYKYVTTGKIPDEIKKMLELLDR
jgi:predicted transcriptional regulator